MLYRDPSQNVNVISGRTLNDHRRTESQKAALAAQIELEEKKLGKLSQRQIARLLDVPRPSILKAKKLDRAHREGLLRGDFSLADIPTVLTDQKLDETVKAAGVERTWQAILKQL